MQIRTLPVYSKLADPPAIPDEVAHLLPAGWSLSHHQLATYAALQDPDVDVVINTAMTGDGKSLAGSLPLLVDKRATLALYPTNELLQDQRASAARTLSTWQRPERWVTDMYGAKLDEMLAELEHTRRGDAILRLFDQHRFVLANPDIFHYILQFCYQQPGKAPDWLAGRVGDNFRQLTFDEFHIFDLPQVAAVLAGMLFLYEQVGRGLKILFLSATPGAFLLPLLTAAGLRTHLVDLDRCYSHGDDPGQGWRPILQGCDLHFDTLRAEEWVDAHLDDILLPFFQEHRPGAKGAIIVGSVAAAQRLLQRIKPSFEAAGLSVMPNTGLTGRAERRDSYAADLLIGTSTVDVGVDFQINFLVFEGSDAGNFLQRLGRLGRHTGYTRNGETHTFTTFQAYALVPDFVYERLSRGYDDAPALLEAGSSITRDTLREVIEAAFPPPATFPLYLKHWGRFQPAHVIASLMSPPIRDNYADLADRLQQRYEATFGIRLSNAWGMAKRMKAEGRELLVQEARSFRGGTPFTCGVLVPASGDTDLEPQTYDLFWLLANAELELLDEAAFFAAGPPSSAMASAIRRSKPVAFVRLLAYRHERSDLMVRLPADIANWGPERHHNAQVLSGLKVELSGVPWLNEVNRRLAQRKVVGLLAPGSHPLELRRCLRLPLLFPLHHYEDVNGGRGCIAFARQALILDTALRYRKLNGDQEGPIIV